MKQLYLVSCLLLIMLSLNTHAAPGAPVAEEAIAYAIKKQWDAPQNPVEIPVIAIGNHYALADWLRKRQD